MAKFICKLKRYRQLKELTQEQLADIVGVRRETIMRLEAGKYYFTLLIFMSHLNR